MPRSAYEENTRTKPKTQRKIGAIKKKKEKKELG